MSRLNENPKVILLFSGKRKSGKDYVTDLLHQRLGADLSVIIRISGPIKSYWAQTHDLNFNELLSSGEAKEQCRKDMIAWSEELRNKDHGVFCRQAIEMYRASEKQVWIVSDVRRQTDINWFQNNYAGKILTIRVEASEDTRTNRDWVFTSGIDDISSECDLDDYRDWNFIVNNNNNSASPDESLNNIITHIRDTFHV